MNREILRLTIPNIISNITIPILGIVDTYIAGHLAKTEFIGAIGLASALFMVVYMAFSFLRMSTSGFTAQAYGSRDKQMQSDILLRALLVAFCGGVFILLIQKWIAGVGFYFMSGSSEVKMYAREYFDIYVWAAPAILAINTVNGWFVGMQNAHYPMYIAISVNIINILLAFLFVMQMNMQLEGIALATLVAQYIGLAFTIIFWLHKYGDFRLFFNFAAINKLSSYIIFFKVNRDIFLRTMLLASVTVFFTSSSAGMGNNVFAANIILMQFFYFFSYVMDGFAYASEALAGKYVGAHEQSKLLRVIKLLFLWGAFFAIIFMLAYAIWGRQIAFSLTDKQEIFPYLLKFKIWVVLLPLASFAAFLWDGIFIGATASVQMRNSMFYAVLIFFCCYLALSGLHSQHVLWISFLVFLISRGVIQTFMAKTIFLKKRISIF